MTSQQFIEWAGLVIGVVIGIATVFIAWMQTRIAARQNEISSALRDLEINRDTPHLVITDCALTSRSNDSGEYTGGPNSYEVTFSVLNVGGGDAWGIHIQIVRIYAETIEGDQDSYPTPDGSFADSHFDLASLTTGDFGHIGLLRAGHSTTVTVPFTTHRHVEDVTAVTILTGTFDSRVTPGAPWRTEGPGGPPDPTWPLPDGTDYFDVVRTPLNELTTPPGRT